MPKSFMQVLLCLFALLSTSCSDQDIAPNRKGGLPQNESTGTGTNSSDSGLFDNDKGTSSGTSSSTGSVSDSGSGSSDGSGGNDSSSSDSDSSSGEDDQTKDTSSVAPFIPSFNWLPRSSSSAAFAAESSSVTHPMLNTILSTPIQLLCFLRQAAPEKHMNQGPYLAIARAEHCGMTKLFGELSAIDSFSMSKMIVEAKAFTDRYEVSTIFSPSFYRYELILTVNKQGTDEALSEFKLDFMNCLSSNADKCQDQFSASHSKYEMVKRDGGYKFVIHKYGQRSESVLNVQNGKIVSGTLNFLSGVNALTRATASFSQQRLVIKETIMPYVTSDGKEIHKCFDISQPRPFAMRYHFFDAAGKRVDMAPIYYFRTKDDAARDGFIFGRGVAYQDQVDGPFQADIDLFSRNADGKFTSTPYEIRRKDLHVTKTIGIERKLGDFTGMRLTYRTDDDKVFVVWNGTKFVNVGKIPKYSGSYQELSGDFVPASNPSFDFPGIPNSIAISGPFSDNTPIRTSVTVDASHNFPTSELFCAKDCFRVEATKQDILNGTNLFYPNPSEPLAYTLDADPIRLKTGNLTYQPVSLTNSERLALERINASTDLFVDKAKTTGDHYTAVADFSKNGYDNYFFSLSGESKVYMAYDKDGKMPPLQSTKVFSYTHTAANDVVGDPDGTYLDKSYILTVRKGMIEGIPEHSRYRDRPRFNIKDGTDLGGYIVKAAEVDYEFNEVALSDCSALSVEPQAATEVNLKNFVVNLPATAALGEISSQ